MVTSSDCDLEVSTVISDVLKRIVNSVENQSDCDSNISKTSNINIPTKLVEQHSVAKSNRLKPSEYLSNLEKDSVPENKCVPGKDDKSDPKGNGKAHMRDGKFQGTIEIVNFDGSLKSGKAGCEISCSGPINSKIQAQKTVVFKKAKSGKQKSRRNPDCLIDQLYHAARAGDKEDFKKLLYVNYDNIVNGLIDSKQSGSCVSSEETDAEVENTGKIFVKNLRTNEQTSPGVTKSAAKTTYSFYDELSESESNLVICEPENSKVVHEHEKEIEDTCSYKVAGYSAEKKRIKTCAKDNRNTDGSKESTNKKRKSVPDFKEISRGVAFKKSKSYIDDNWSQNFKEQLPSDRTEVRESLETEVPIVRTEDIKKEVSTDDTLSSSELDDSFATKIYYYKSHEDESTCASDSSCIDEKLTYDFYCQHCEKKYNNLVHLRNHQAACHLHEDTFICEACSKVFFSFEKLKEHERIHVKEEINYCELCKRGYSSRTAIKRHAETVHVADKPRPHKCKICNQAFTCVWHLREHYRIHDNERKFVCPVCSRGFNHCGSMNRHAKDQHNFDTSTGKYFKGKPKPVLISPVKVQLVKKPRPATTTQPIKEEPGTQEENLCREVIDGMQQQSERIVIKVEQEDPDFNY